MSELAFSYKPLWKLILEKNINKTQLRDRAKITNQTLSRLSKNQNVSMEILGRICKTLDCRLEDIVEYVNEKKDLSMSLDTISLFSGAGGLDLGLINSGFNIVFANDILKPAIENYRANIGEITEEDITKINANDMPNADVVVAGFPCQPFSSAGNRLGTKDDRGNLYLEVLKVINAKKPKVVIMENVRGLLSMKNKDGSKLMDSIVTLLENTEPGYKVKYKLLKASNYGVPQNRFRVIIIGIRSDINIDYEFPEPIDYDPEKLTVGYVLKGVEGLPNQNEVWELSPQSKKLVPFIPEGGNES